MRNPPKTIASTKGTTTMATTFHRTGQFRSDHEAGRFVDEDAAVPLFAV
jgi:hypothetical protein